MSKTKEYHVYVDGCSMSGKNRHGIGWVQTNEDGKFLKSHAERLPIHGATSTITEIYAAQNALANIPDGSNVVIYSDNATVCDALARKNFYDPQKHRKPKLSEAWTELAVAASHHDEVSVIFTREKNEYYMHRAHLNAQTGAMKPLKHEPDYEYHYAEKYPKNTITSAIYENDENMCNPPEVM